MSFIVFIYVYEVCCSYFVLTLYHPLLSLSWDIIKLKNSCKVKEKVVGMKRQPTDWQKIFARSSSDKGFLSRIKSSKKLILKEQIIQLINVQIN
jgi:hypothetical protein